MMDLSKLLKFIEETEKAHFRTNTDTGANANAMIIWNRLRVFAGLNQLTLGDLPAYCHKCNKYHKTGTNCIFSRQCMITLLVERDISTIRSNIYNNEESFLDSILRGEGFTQYNNMSDEQITIEFQEMVNKE